MKQMIVGFDQFVNEMYDGDPYYKESDNLGSSPELSNCCGSDIDDDGNCTECGMPNDDGLESTESEDFGMQSDDDSLPAGNDMFAKDLGDLEEIDPENARHASMYEGKAKKFGEPAPPIGKGKGGFPDIKPLKKAPAKPAAKDTAKSTAKYGGFKPGAKKELMEKDPKQIGKTNDKGKPEVNNKFNLAKK